MTTIVIGYHEDTGEAIDGTMFFGVKNDREACVEALAWVAHDSAEKVGGWRAFEILTEWSPGREIKPIESDYS